MLLKELLQDIYNVDTLEEFGDIEIDDIATDSREVREGSVFVALQGTCSHGKNFIDDAVSKGARIVVLEEKADCSLDNSDVLLLYVSDSSEFLQQI